MGGSVVLSADYSANSSATTSSISRAASLVGAAWIFALFMEGCDSPSTQANENISSTSERLPWYLYIMGSDTSSSLGLWVLCKHIKTHRTMASGVSMVVFLPLLAVLVLLALLVMVVRRRRVVVPLLLLTIRLYCWLYTSQSPAGINYDVEGTLEQRLVP